MKVSEDFEAVTFNVKFLAEKRWDVLERALYRLTERVVPGLTYYIQETEDNNLTITVEKEKK